MVDLSIAYIAGRVPIAQHFKIGVTEWNHVDALHSDFVLLVSNYMFGTFEAYGNVFLVAKLASSPRSSTTSSCTNATPPDEIPTRETCFTSCDWSLKTSLVDQMCLSLSNQWLQTLSLSYRNFHPLYRHKRIPLSNRRFNFCAILN